MAIWYKADGSQVSVDPANGKTFSLAELQGYCGGYVEIVALNKTEILVVNEDGIGLELDLNLRASALYGEQILVGDVLRCLRAEVR